MAETRWSRIDTQPYLGRVISSSRGRTRFGTPYVRLCLDTGEDVRTAYFWRANVGPYSLPKDLEVVVDASPRYWNGEVIWDIDGIEPARLSRRVQLSGGLSVLPRWLLKLASHPETVRRLWAHLHLLQNRCLREFALRVFQDPDLAVPFVISPASRDHHHQEPGGLLQHSLECMIQLPKIAGLAQDEWEVARIAVLFHDIGKIHMAYGQTRGSAEGVLSRHDDATLEVLAPHLAWLRAQDADLLAALKHHLLWHPRLGRPWMPGVLLVRCLDQISAALDARRRAFGDRPRKTQYARLAVRGPENRFWRLASPGGTGMHGEDSA